MRIAIASGKGGTGKTFVATNLFQVFLKNNLSIALTDCDVEEPNATIFFNHPAHNKWEVHEYRPEINKEACLFCGKCASYCTFNAIFCLPPAKIIKLTPELCHGCKACEVACMNGAITPSSSIIGYVTSHTIDNDERIFEGRLLPKNILTVPVIKSAIEHSAKAATKYYIYDSPPGTSCPFIHTVIRSDYVILVAEPTPFGLSDLKQSVETLNELDIKFGVVINRCDMGNSELANYLEAEKIDVLAEIPFSREFAQLYASGKLAVEHSITARTIFTELMSKCLELTM